VVKVNRWRRATGVLEETEGAGAVELKDGATGAYEVRWLGWGKVRSWPVQWFTNTKSQGQDGYTGRQADRQMGRWADGKTGKARKSRCYSMQSGRTARTYWIDGRGLPGVQGRDDAVWYGMGDGQEGRRGHAKRNCRYAGRRLVVD
jgi:hypothetical protein